MTENETDLRVPIETAAETKKMPAMRWRVGLSVVAGVGWVIFLILWLFFYASAYTVYQNIAISIVSFFVMLGVLGATWASMLKMFRPPEDTETTPELLGMRWRIGFSILLGVGWLVFLSGWLFFYASTYTVFQNIAVTIISFIIIGAIIGITWGSVLRTSSSPEHVEEMPTMGWRIGVSMILGMVWVGFLLLWLLFYASEYTAYQNIAIFLTSLLIMVAINAPIWTLVRTKPDNNP